MICGYNIAFLLFNPVAGPDWNAGDHKHQFDSLEGSIDQDGRQLAMGLTRSDTQKVSLEIFVGIGQGTFKKMRIVLPTDWGRQRRYGTGLRKRRCYRRVPGD
jgi:hypothetical protein